MLCRCQLLKRERWRGYHTAESVEEDFIIVPAIEPE